MHCGYVTTLKDVRPHPNADRLVLATCFTNTVCVAKDKYTEGQVGVYFPVDLQLSMEFCEQNGLLAVYIDGINVSGGYMDPAKRNVKAIKLRGEQSDGLFLPLECLAYTHIDLSTLNIGDTITTINGHEICKKYIPRGKHPATVAGGAGKRVKRRAKRSIAPVFYEHKDTEQLAYNLHVFKPGDEIEITRKLHGTSARTSHTKILKGFKRTLLDIILRREGTPIYDWGIVSGTRRTVLDTFDGGFYGSNEFRKPYHDFFDGKLLKGETVYYEIVGYTHDGGTIMGVCDNKKLKDKEFVKKYGEKTVFSYGCVPVATEEKPQSDIYVYRMTMTNEDGEVVEYTPDQMRHRCMYTFQKRYSSLWDDGVAGPDTLKILYGAGAATTKTPAASLGKTYAQGDKGADIKALQNRLKELGFYKKTIDGEYGATTKAAVTAFQAANGLSETGKVNETTLTKLYSASAKDVDYLADEENAKNEEDAEETGNQSSSNVVVNGYTTLQWGDTGAAVKKLQEALKNRGFYSGKIDSTFGSGVYAAVKAFQKQYGLKADGVAGPATQNLLFNTSASSADTSTSLQKGSSGTEVRNLQYVLAELGYYDGAINGQYGNTTADAVRAFQINNDISPVDGVAGPKTLKVIYSSKAIGATASSGSYDTLSKGDKGTAVVEMQEKLKKLGYLSEVTGAFDTATVEAVKNFQRRNDLTVNGKANSATLSKLYSKNPNPAW